jgi:hypothetical protein
MIRVGRCTYNKQGKRTDPSYAGFTSIIVLMKSHSPYGDLGPYNLTDNQGRIFENIYQFVKVYREVPYTKEYYSRYDPKVIWEHPVETHVDEHGELTPAYWQWREKGMNCEYHIRYPVGFKHRYECLYAIRDQNDLTKLDYIEARKEIYVKIYCELVRKEQKFIDLKNRLDAGENLLIIEVDGPHQESLNYYKEEYGVDDDFIENGTMLAIDENLMIMLNDPKHPFGHGYCLAMALLDLDDDLINL